MLRALDIQGANVAVPLLQVSTIIIDDQTGVPRRGDFLRRNSKWHRHLKADDADYHRLWEVAVLFHLRDAFRSGDIWLGHSRRYADLKQALMPLEIAKSSPRLTMPFEPDAWLMDQGHGQPLCI